MCSCLFCCGPELVYLHRGHVEVVEHTRREGFGVLRRLLRPGADGVLVDSHRPGHPSHAPPLDYLEGIDDFVSFKLDPIEGRPIVHRECLAARCTFSLLSRSVSPDQPHVVMLPPLLTPWRVHRAFRQANFSKSLLLMLGLARIRHQTTAQLGWTCQ